MIPPLHLSIPSEHFCTQIRIEFHSKLDDFDVYINDVSRKFTSLRQAYTYLHAIFGSNDGLQMLSMMAKHCLEH